MLRFDGPDGINKDFLPLTWSGDAARPGEWRWKSGDVRRPLYGLDRLAARREVPVIVAEGARHHSHWRKVLQPTWRKPFNDSLCC